MQTTQSTERFAVSKSLNRANRAKNQKMKYRIKELRQARGWTQEHLAMLAGTNKGYISQLESGKREPSTETLRSLAAAFEVEAAQMIESSSPSDADAVRLLSDFERLAPADKETVLHLVQRLMRSGDA